MITAALIKAKAYLIAIVVGFVNSTVRYIIHKRKLREGTLKKNAPTISFVDWLLFGAMASIVTMTGVAVLEYCGIEFTMPMGVLLFWLGYLTDYLFEWIPLFLKSKFDNYLKK